MTKPLHNEMHAKRAPANISIDQLKRATGITETKPFKPNEDEEVNDAARKPSPVANNRPLEKFSPGAIVSPISGLSPDETLRMINTMDQYNRAHESFNWDAALAAFEKADREDLTSSAYRNFKYRFSNVTESFDETPRMTGEEFNTRYPADEAIGERPLKANRSLNEVQRDMVLSARDENRKLTKRMAKGRDNFMQGAMNFTAEMFGSATAADVGISLVAAPVEAYLLAARWLPKMFRPILTAIQAGRKSSKLRPKAAVNVGENLLLETATIPMEQLDRETSGLKQYGAGDIAFRAIGGIFFAMGLSSFAHILQNSKYWMNFFEENFPEAAKQLVRHFTLMKEGVPYDPVVMGKTWNEMTPKQRQNYVERSLEPGPDVAPVTDIPTLEKSEEALTAKVNSLLNEEYTQRKAEFDALENKEGVEPPKQETYKSIIEEYDDANISIKEHLRELANCLTKG